MNSDSFLTLFQCLLFFSFTLWIELTNRLDCKSGSSSLLNSLGPGDCAEFKRIASQTSRIFFIKSSSSCQNHHFILFWAHFQAKTKSFDKKIKSVACRVYQYLFLVICILISSGVSGQILSKSEMSTSSIVIDFALFSKSIKNDFWMSKNGQLTILCV